MPLSYDLTLFQILGQKFVKFFVGILVQTMTPKGHFEINWPLKSIQFKIPDCEGNGPLEFIKGLDFDQCYYLKKIIVQGNFTTALGFRSSYRQENFQFDFGFPVDVLEMSFHPREKNDLYTRHIQKLRLNLSAHKRQDL